MRGRLAPALVAVAALTLAACGDADPVAESPSPTPTAIAAPAPSPSPEPTEAPRATGSDFYAAANSSHTAYQQLVNEGRDDEAELLKRISDQPTSTWLGDWQSADAAGSTARRITLAAAEADQIPVFVVYAIPGRDCGLHSAGGLPEQTYLTWVQAVADGISEGGGNAWVVLEPDAVAQIGDCDGQGDRVGLLRGASMILDEAGADVFLDAGNSNWRGASDTADRIAQVGTSHLTGFSTNVSNYNRTADERAWGEEIAAATGLSFIVDTSRNGNGSDGEWCNPRGRALGEAPALVDDGPMAATVWIKAPGESDGSCNGGPPAGHWWMDVALELARNA